VAALVTLLTAPPLPVIPEVWHGKKVAALIAVALRPDDEAAEFVQEFRTLAEPIADLLGPMPYTVIQSLIDPLWQKGIKAYFKSTNLGGLDDDLIDSLAAAHRAAPGPQCEIHVHQMGGAVARVGAGETAFGDRSAPFVLNAVAGWHDPAVADEHVGWSRSVIDAAAHASTGRAYSNFLGDAGQGRSSYGPETYARLVALKDEYDPTNVFRLNQNVEPSA
jgi:hypothetical protein